MAKFILKTKSFENASGNIALRGNVALKISSKINASDDAIVQIKKSLSVRGDNLAKILNSKSSQPLFIDTNGPSITTSSNICDDENVQPQSNNEGTPPKMINGMDNLTPPSVVSQFSAMNVNPKTPQNYHMLARLQRDLDSPSAAVRLRAMRALKSPSNGPYNQFDVPHEEQDIITDEERQEIAPKTIQDVMKDVIVFVEMRSGDVNLTPSIKEFIAGIGATVNDNFNKNTTHLVFSNGTQSTYNRAKRLNIPIVSILWIKECKKQLRLVDPNKYSIHNAQQYENPELHKKAKVKKFLQSETELIIKKKKFTPTLVKSKPIKIPKKARDNLTGMFNEWRSRSQIPNSDGINYFSENFNVADLLNDTESRTVNTNRAEASKLSVRPKGAISASSSKDKDNSTAISNISSKVQNNKAAAALKTPATRKTMFVQSATPDSLVRVTRRTSMLSLSSTPVDTTPIQRNHFVIPEEINEITNNQTNNNSEAMEITPTNAKVSPIIFSNKETIFTSTAMDITNTLPPPSTSTRKRVSIIPAKFKDFEVNSKKYLKNSTETIHSQTEKINRRRTVLALSVTKPSVPTVSTLREIDNAKKSAPHRRRTSNATKLPNGQATALSEASPMVGVYNSTIRRALFKSGNETPGPLAKPIEATPTGSKRRRTLFAANNATLNSLAVSTLIKAVENSNRRRIVFGNESSNPSGTLSHSTPNEIQNRRRTCLTTSHTAGNQSPAVSNDKLNNVSIAQITPTERNKAISRDYLTPQNRTLFEEYSQKLSFSSTNKRQSVGDISLFILEQRLKNINEIARLNRSVSETNVNIENVGGKFSEEIARSSPQLLPAEKTNGNDEVLPPPPKKRKLFNPTEYEEEVAMKCVDSTDNNNQTIKASVVTQKTKIPKLAAHKKRLNQRRSTMDFKKEPPKPVKVYASTLQSNSTVKYLAYSNVNEDQIKIINEAIALLGNVTVESNVTKKTTHLVTFDSKRTQKFLRAIIRGLWIINFDWVTASLQAGTWLYEEPFENRSISSAVSMCRAEAQAFGSKYKIEIFDHIDAIYISTKCRCPALEELYTMCGGRVTNSRSRAKYIITDKFKKNVSQLCLRSDWILDSISSASCKHISSYILRLAPVSVPV